MKTIKIRSMGGTGNATARAAMCHEDDMPRPKKPICKKCQSLEKRAKFWRDLAGRYKATLDQISPLPSRRKTTDG